MTIYRVFPYDPGAVPDEPGGALFRPHGGHGRIDNPDRYRTLYASSHAQGAVAEAFGRFPEWTDETLLLHGTRRALQAYELDERAAGVPAFYDLDDAANLLSAGLRPSQVVTRDRKTTQAWAMQFFDRGERDGVAWWSYYQPDWRSIGLWNLDRIRPLGAPEPLTLAHPAVRAAATEIARILR